LAVKFARETQDEHNIPFVFFIGAGNLSGFKDALRDIVTQLKLKEGNTENHKTHKKALERWLSDPERGKWLMIIDDAHDLDTFKSFPPRVHHGFVLFTRQTQRIPHPQNGDIAIVIEPLPEQSCRQLLSVELGRLDDHDLDNAGALITHSAGIPSVLMSAVHWMREHGSMSEYVKSHVHQNERQQETITGATSYR